MNIFMSNCHSPLPILTKFGTFRWPLIQLLNIKVHKNILGLLDADRERQQSLNSCVRFCILPCEHDKEKAILNVCIFSRFCNLYPEYSYLQSILTLRKITESRSFQKQMFCSSTLNECIPWRTLLGVQREVGAVFGTVFHYLSCKNLGHGKKCGNILILLPHVFPLMARLYALLTFRINL
jgi:hypothetical protein